MNIFKKIPEHIRKHPRKLLLRKSPVNAFRMMMDCRKLRTGIAPVSAGVLDKTPLSYDQLTLGYCFAEAAAGAYDTEYFKQYGHYYNPSPMFIGNMTKFLEGSFGVDNGATNAGAINALRQYGVCKDSEFTYGESNLAVMPPENVMEMGIHSVGMKPRGSIIALWATVRLFVSKTATESLPMLAT